MKRPLSVGLCLLALACERTPEEPPLSTLVITSRAGDAIALDRVTLPPSVQVRRVERGPTRVEFSIVAPNAAVEVSAPGACAVSVPSTPGAVSRVELAAAVRVKGKDLAQLGFDQPFVLNLVSNCGAITAARWRQLEGPHLKLTVEQGGRVARGRTPTLKGAVGARHPTGLIPIAPRTRGRVVLAVDWEKDEQRGTTTITLAAAARATGLPSVAARTRLWLGAGDWSVSERPEGARGSTAQTPVTTSFLPDAAGRWVLARPSGETLALTVGSHSGTALDCGRAGCHVDATKHAAHTAMTTVFARGMNGKLANWNAGCVIGCHTTGDPGIDDGGFDHVQRLLAHPALPTPGPDPDAYAALPSALRRQAGVTCTACHGPGAIPEPSASWAVLRADVCATCHDAPPRYQHVTRWRSTRMAGADATPETRAAACRGCHTTAGFLERIGASKKPRTAPETKAETETIGIACAACHAPHAADSGAALLRKPALPAGFPELPTEAESSRVCISCHAAEAGGPPQASLIFGRDGSEPAPHAALGCTGCHGAREREPHGASHDFRVRTAVCKRCHQDDAQEKVAEGKLSIRERALALTRAGLPTAAPHARADLPRSRLSWLLDDRGAAAHNAAAARRILEEAETSRR